jgi:hypothetical protein
LLNFVLFFNCLFCFKSVLFWIPGSTFLHTGKSRAPACAAAYIIRRWGLSLSRALEILEKAMGNLLDISEGYMHALRVYSERYTLGEMLCADCLQGAVNQAREDELFSGSLSTLGFATTTKSGRRSSILQKVDADERNSLSALIEKTKTLDSLGEREGEGEGVESHDSSPEGSEASETEAETTAPAPPPGPTDSHSHPPTSPSTTPTPTKSPTTKVARGVSFASASSDAEPIYLATLEERDRAREEQEAVRKEAARKADQVVQVRADATTSKINYLSRTKQRSAAPDPGYEELEVRASRVACLMRLGNNSRDIRWFLPVCSVPPQVQQLRNYRMLLDLLLPGQSLDDASAREIFPALADLGVIRKLRVIDLKSNQLSDGAVKVRFQPA